jgi:hypothetical protein
LTEDEGGATVCPGCDGSGISVRAQEYRKENLITILKTDGEQIMRIPMIVHIAHHIPNQSSYIKRNTTYKIIFNYPLARDFEFTFVTTDNRYTHFDVADFVVNIYKNVIYKDEKSCEEYGVWGHDLRDLVLEGIEIDNNNNIIKLLVGS